MQTAETLEKSILLKDTKNKNLGKSRIWTKKSSKKEGF